MAKNRVITIAIAAGFLLIIWVGFRGSFISANVTSLVEDLAQAQLRVKSLESQLADANRDLAHQGTIREDLQRERSQKMALQQQLESAGAEAARSAQLEQQVSSLQSQNRSLEQRLEALSPPEINRSRPGRSEWWVELCADLASNKNAWLNLDSFTHRLGQPAFSLVWRSDAGKWDDKTWERVIFPRFKCRQTEWPRSLDSVKEATKAFAEKLRQNRIAPDEGWNIHSFTVVLWPLDESRHAVAVSADVERMEVLLGGHMDRQKASKVFSTQVIAIEKLSDR